MATKLQRKYGGYGTSTAETPTGTVNGINVTFTLSHTPDAASLTFYINGLSVPQKAGTDGFSVSGTTITVGSPPAVAQTVWAVYAF